MIVYIDMDRIAVIRVISLKRLIEGGAAMFPDTIKNHHIDMVGRKHIIPFIRNKLRVWVIS
jgi:hypothetical protein